MSVYVNMGTLVTTVAVSVGVDRSGNFYCTGASDDVQINAALTYVNALGGGEVRLLQGTFVLADPITFPGNNLVLSGLGVASFIDGDGLATTEHGIVLTGYTDCTIKDLSIQTEEEGDKTCHCIFIGDGSDRFQVDNVWVLNSDEDGIHVEGTTITGGYINNCQILRADDNGIFIFGFEDAFLTSIRIIDCYISGVGGNGIAYTGPGNAFQWLIHGNVIFHAEEWEPSCGADGIQIIGMFQGVIDDNIIEMTTNNGIYVLPTTACSVSNNIIGIWDQGSTGGFDAIHLEGDHAVINGNVIWNGAEFTPFSGIHITGNANVISDNTIRDTIGTGIYITSHLDCIISNNSLHGTGQSDGIYVAAGSHFSIIGNFISWWGDNGLEFASEAGDHSTVYSNYFKNNDDNGIELVDDTDNIHILGNYFYWNGTYGVSITTANADDNWVRNNYYYNNGTAPILDNGTDTRLPEVFMPVTDPDGTIGEHPCIDLPDAADTTVRFQIPTPVEFQQLVRAQVVIVAGGNGDMQWSTVTNYGRICTTDHYDVRSDAETDQTTAVLINDMSCINVNDSLTGLLAGDLVGFRFIRRGTQGGDTVEADCYFLGFRMQYV